MFCSNSTRSASPPVSRQLLGKQCPKKKSRDREITMNQLTRRQALATAGAAVLGGTLDSIGPLRAATEITAVEWGGDVVNAMKKIEGKQDKVKVNWVLHQGGSGAILPKIKATWPKADYDYVSGWEGSFNGMVKEDWLVPVTVQSVPNLADIPQKIIVKNAKGDWMAVPRAVGGIYLAYRKDICPFEVKSIDDLFDARLKGKICWPGPTQAMMLPLVALSLHAGGNEKNMDPGFALMKKLAQSGNIGRVGVTDTDFSTSLTSGETAVGFYSEPQLTMVAKSFPVVRLTTQAGVPTFLYQSGFAIFKHLPNLQPTLQFANSCSSPEMSAL